MGAVLAARSVQGQTCGRKYRESQGKSLAFLSMNQMELRGIRDMTRKDTPA